MKIFDRTRPQAVGLSIALALSTVILIAGCSKESALEPLADGAVAVSLNRDGLEAGYGSGSFYPLAEGNRWEYEGLATMGVVEDDGSVTEGDLPISYTESHRIVGNADREGRSYAVRRETRRSYAPLGDDETTFYSLVRQDRTALFAADVTLPEPPVAARPAGHRAARATPGSTIGVAIREGLRRHGASAATAERLARRVEIALAAIRGSAPPPSGGASPTELTWLLYPLRPGQSWDIRQDFPWPAVVAGVEILDTPAGRFPAYRIETDPFGTTVADGEWIRLYYGRAGYLGYSVHLYEPGTDEHGDPTGTTYLFDDDMLLTSADIAR